MSEQSKWHVSVQEFNSHYETVTTEIMLTRICLWDETFIQRNISVALVSRHYTNIFIRLYVCRVVTLADI